MGKKDVESGRPGSLGAAVAASAKRKRERAKGGTPSSPPKAAPRVQASGRRSKPARSRRGLEHSDVPAPRAPASPESVSPQRSPLRWLPRRVQPQGTVAESAIRRRPAAFSAPEGQGRVGEVPSWIWTKKWAESYLSEGGILQLNAIHWDAGSSRKPGSGKNFHDCIWAPFKESQAAHRQSVTYLACVGKPVEHGDFVAAT